MQAKKIINDESLKHEFSDEEIKVFDQRRNKRLKGESKIYSWEEAKAIITASKSKSLKSK